MFAKLKAATGGRLRIFVSGGAPLSAEIAKFFYAAGLPILEGYGLTETSPVIAVNTFEHHQARHGGAADPRGPGENRLGWRDPDPRSSHHERVLQQAGCDERGDRRRWLVPYRRHRAARRRWISQDHRPQEGHHRHRGGKNIAPQPIENRVKSNKFVSNAVMIGDKRKFPIMLVVPNMDNLKAWAHAKNLAFADEASLIELPQAGDKIEREMKKSCATWRTSKCRRRSCCCPATSVSKGRADADAQGQAESRGAELPEPDRGALFGVGRRHTRRLAAPLASPFAPPTNPPASPSDSSSARRGGVPSPTTLRPGSTHRPASLCHSGLDPISPPSTTPRSDRDLMGAVGPRRRLTEGN